MLSRACVSWPIERREGISGVGALKGQELKQGDYDNVRQMMCFLRTEKSNYDNKIIKNLKNTPDDLLPLMLAGLIKMFCEWKGQLR